MTTKTMDLSDISADVRCQSRTELDDALVAEYAEQIVAGVTFPPLMAIQADGGTFLYDGFHRFYALKRAGRTSTKIEVEPGTLRDAILRSAGANATHGKRRTNADKRRSVETLLGDAEWSGWSNHEIARRCWVSDVTVAKYRAEVTTNICSDNLPTRSYQDRHGNISTMNTSNIGKRESTAVQETDRLSDLDYQIVDPGTADPIPHQAIPDQPPPSSSALNVSVAERDRQQVRNEQETASHIFEVAGDPNGDVDRARLRYQFSKARSDALSNLFGLIPKEVVATLSHEDMNTIGWFITDARAWLNALESEIGQPIRLVRKGA